MALSTTNFFPKTCTFFPTTTTTNSPTSSPKTSTFLPPTTNSTSRPFPPAFLRVSRTCSNLNNNSRRSLVVFATFSSSASNSSDFNPYEVLGVNPLEGFDMVKAAYAKKRKDAEMRGDEATAAQLEKVYDSIMMSQLNKRKKGETFGSFRVSKDIKYADKQPVVPWGPRRAKSEAKDIQINMAISAVFTVWIFVQRTAEYKPLQFLAFMFFYRMFEKLKASEAPASSTFTEEGEDEGRMMRMGKRLLRSFALVFGCVALASVGYTAVLNVLEFATGYVPVFLYNNQELLVTASTALMLHVLVSYYR